MKGEGEAKAGLYVDMKNSSGSVARMVVGLDVERDWVARIAWEANVKIEGPEEHAWEEAALAESKVAALEGQALKASSDGGAARAILHERLLICPESTLHGRLCGSPDEVWLRARPQSSLEASTVRGPQTTTCEATVSYGRPSPSAKSATSYGRAPANHDSLFSHGKPPAYPESIVRSPTIAEVTMSIGRSPADLQASMIYAKPAGGQLEASVVFGGRPLVNDEAALMAAPTDESGEVEAMTSHQMKRIRRSAQHAQRTISQARGSWGSSGDWTSDSPAFRTLHAILDIVGVLEQHLQELATLDSAFLSSMEARKGCLPSAELHHLELEYWKTRAMHVEAITDEHRALQDMLISSGLPMKDWPPVARDGLATVANQACSISRRSSPPHAMVQPVSPLSAVAKLQTAAVRVKEAANTDQARLVGSPILEVLTGLDKAQEQPELGLSKFEVQAMLAALAFKGGDGQANSNSQLLECDWRCDPVSPNAAWSVGASPPPLSTESSTPRGGCMSLARKRERNFRHGVGEDGSFITPSFDPQALFQAASSVGPLDPTCLLHTSQAIMQPLLTSLLGTEEAHDEWHPVCCGFGQRWHKQVPGEAIRRMQVESAYPADRAARVALASGQQQEGIEDSRSSGGGLDEKVRKNWFLRTLGGFGGSLRNGLRALATSVVIMHVACVVGARDNRRWR